MLNAPILRGYALTLLGHPLFALLLVGIAVAASAAIVRFVAPVRNTLERKEISRFQALDALRGLLALGVMASHVPITWSYITRGKWFFLNDSNVYALLGEVCVALFFMTTGFLFWQKLLKSSGRLDIPVFLIGRIFRIYPLYLAVLVLVLFLSFALQDWQHRETIAETLRECVRWCTFYASDLNRLPNTSILIARVEWSLRYEWFFYGMLPVAAVVFSATKRHYYGLLAGIFLMGCLAVFDPAHRFVPRQCAAFLGGITAAYLSLGTNSFFVQARTWLQHWVSSIFALGALLGVLCFASSAYSLVSLCLLSVVFAAVASGNRLFGLLKPASILWLGEISYGIYLLHGIVLWFGCQVLVRFCSDFPEQPNPIVFCLCACGVSVGAVCVASFAHIFIEQPGIEAGKRCAQWWRQMRQH
ncbi:MAG: acyltransferase [Candidatus Kapaibacterium sp.]|nr:MAG: acyltransferase [Candidatus Kapabacteria bacterium]